MDSDDRHDALNQSQHLEQSTSLNNTNDFFVNIFQLFNAILIN